MKSGLDRFIAREEGMEYLVTTRVFRIDHRPVVLLPGAMSRRSIKLTTEELALAGKVRAERQRERRGKTIFFTLYDRPYFGLV